MSDADIKQDVVEFSSSDKLIFCDGFDDAIIGITDGCVCYDKMMMVHILLEDESWEPEEAYEFLEFNTWCAYIGTGSPFFIDVYHDNKKWNVYNNIMTGDSDE